MSGICGVVAKRRFARNESPETELALLSAMAATMQRRGPDDAGFLLVGGPAGERRLETADAVPATGRGGDGATGRESRRPSLAPSPVRPGPPLRGGAPPSRFEVGLGVRRLAVSDPEGGHQPIGNEEGTIWVVLDGVIVNAGELRRELTQGGHRFATRAEAEVIVHAYEQYGPDGLRRLRGQYALALWDDRRRLLLLARDPSGLRPLFIAETGERFLFASEVAALRRDVSIGRSIDPETARHFLEHASLPGDRTLFREIRSLPPGQVLIHRSGGTRIESLREEPRDTSMVSSQAVDPAEAWGVVRQTIAAYLTSDLPGPTRGCGLFLDGSLASAALVLAARETCDADLPIFTPGGRGEIQARSRRLSRALRIDPRPIQADGVPAELWARLLRILDHPPADAGALAPFQWQRSVRLCRGTGDAVTVVLAPGDGSWVGGFLGLEVRAPFRDEVFLRYAGGAAGVEGVLRHALAGRAPRWLLRRPEAVSPAASAWRELGGLAGAVGTVLVPDAVRARGLVSPENVARLRDGSRRGDEAAARRLWTLLALELWLRIHVDRDLRDDEELSAADLGLTGSPAPVAVRSGFGPSPVIFGTPAFAGDGGRPLSILLATEADPAEPYTAPARLAREWSARLAARGHRVTIVTGREDGSPASDFELLDGVEIVRFPVTGRRPADRARARAREGERALRRLARERALDVAIVDHPCLAAACRRAEVGRDTLRLYLFHGAEPAGEGGSRRWSREERAALLGCDGVLAPSRLAAARLATRHGELGLPVTLMPGGVDPARFRPDNDRYELRYRMGLPESAFLLLAIRPMETGMGLENLVTAMAGVHAAYPEAHLVIGGAGSLESALRRQIVHQRIGRAVTLAGRIPEETLPAYYAAADLFVMPSARPDGMGLAAGEALACGTPVFSTPVGALPERLTHLDPRFLFAGTGAGAIADGIIRYLPDLHHDDTLRRRCRQFALEHYDWDVLIPQLELHLRERADRCRRTAVPLPSSPRGLVPRWPCFE